MTNTTGICLNEKCASTEALPHECKDLDGNALDDLGEGACSYQAWICPICFDDHSFDKLDECVEKLKKEVDEVKEQRQEFYEALLFYADPKNWRSTHQLAAARIDKSDHERLAINYSYGGKRARETIGKRFPKIIADLTQK